MNSKKRSTDTSRRDALKSLGLASAATLATPLISGSASSAVASPVRSAGASLKVGLLLPVNAPHSRSMQNGLELYFEQTGYKAGSHRIDLGIRGIDFGISRAMGVTRELVHNQRVDLMVGMINSRAGRWLHEICKPSGTPFLEVGAGESRPHPRDVSPLVFRHTLGLWQSGHAAGLWAARTMGKRCVVATSYYDSGFDTLQAFRLGFESGGGTILHTHITGAPIQPSSPGMIMTGISNASPDFVYAAYSGGEAAEFLQAYHRAGLNGRVPLLGSGLIAETHNGGFPADVMSALGWSAGLNNDENRKFAASYSARYGGAPDAFALLGYDTAHIITEAGKNSSLLSGLRSVSFASPRGPLSADPHDLSFRTPIHLQRVRSASGAPTCTVLAQLGTLCADGAAGTDALNQNGWISSYLTV